DVGTQYRSAIYTYGDAQQKTAAASRDAYQQALARAGHGAITTEIRPAPAFYYAEDYHQQYLAKNPGGYCGIGRAGVARPARRPARRRTASPPRSPSPSGGGGLGGGGKTDVSRRPSPCSGRRPPPPR